MSEPLVLVFLGDRPALFELEALRAALARGEALGLGPNSAPAPRVLATEDVLVDSKAMALRAGVAEGKIESLARAGRIPSVMVGRWRRYSPRQVLAALPRQPRPGAKGALSGV